MPWIEQVHDAAYLDFLKQTSDNVDASVADKGVKPGDVKAIYPSVHPYVPNPRATNPLAERGKYMFDMYTPIMQGTYEVAVESAACAVAGAKLLKDGEKQVYALTRPPGHHAEEAMMGGYCYINNAAVAAQYLRSAGADRVAIFDFDIHHGNGTQNIFYGRDDVFFASIHASPDIKFPFYTGYEDEHGEGDGAGFNYNIPLPEGIDDATYDVHVAKVLKRIRDFHPNYLVVSAGFDTHAKDPIGAFRLTTDYFGKLGKDIASLEFPTLTVQEGGYATDVLGENVVSYLKGFRER